MCCKLGGNRFACFHVEILKWLYLIIPLKPKVLLFPDQYNKRLFILMAAAKTNVTVISGVLSSKVGLQHISVYVVKCQGLICFIICAS